MSPSLRHHDGMKRIAILLGLAACGGDDGGFTDASPTFDAGPDATSCPKLWTVTNDPGASAFVTGGVVLLSASNIADDSAIELTQTGLTGDFDATFAFSGFTSGGTGAFLQAAISADVATPPRKLTAAIGTSPTVGISAADQPGGSVDIQATTLKSGELHFVRAGDQVTVTATTADQTATITATYAVTPLRIGVQLGSNNGAIAPETSVSIGAFTLAAGTGVTGDTFDCDSLQ